MKKLIAWIILNIIFILAISQPVYSLGWSDKEWIEAGCPENISGQWTLRDDPSLDSTPTTVSNNQFTFSLKTGEIESINFEKLSESSTATILSLNTHNILNSEQVLPYMKIRPHLVKAVLKPGVQSSYQAECLIKVFRYQSQNQIRPDKYVKWNIYQIKTQN